MSKTNRDFKDMGVFLDGFEDLIRAHWQGLHVYRRALRVAENDLDRKAWTSSARVHRNALVDLLEVRRNGFGRDSYWQRQIGDRVAARSERNAS